MGMAVAGGKRGILCEANVVSLIDILLVLLVIFMIIPHKQVGLDAALPQQASGPVQVPPPETAIIVQVASDGAVRINGSEVKLDELRGRLERVLALRAHPVAFLRFARVSSGSAGTGPHACGGSIPGRINEFGTGKNPLNVMEWPL